VRARAGALAASALCLCASGACSRHSGGAADADVPILDGSIVSAPSATAPGAPRQGMVWIPSGILKAGTPPDQVPRVAAEELPGADVPLGGFYIDELPWPNEAGAIPSTNVTRDEAIGHCAAKGKRLCTELEWERACKGPAMTRYEYGDDYRPGVCGTGASIEQGARQPMGERLACRSAFGVREMHGSVFEWTDSAWGRGNPKNLYTVRGGNAVAGDIVGRCANGRGAAPDVKSPAIGFRCCAGPRNDAQVELDVKTGQALHKLEEGDDPPPAAVGPLGCGAPGEPTQSCTRERVWVWRPSGNVVLWVKGGCAGGEGDERRCGILVARVVDGRAEVMANVEAGHEPPEVVLLSGEGRKIRMKGGYGEKDVFFRELSYAYGKVEVREIKGG
jgi:formylglycine-generating enzyme required for sulfatase activity